MFTVLLWITTMWLIRRTIRKEIATVKPRIAACTARAKAVLGWRPWRRRPQPQWRI